MSRELGGVRQAGYVVRDIEAAVQYWTTVLGVGPFFYIDRLPLQRFVYGGRPSDPHVSVALGYSGELQVELIQQRDDAPSMWRDFLDAGHEGLHHLAFWTTQFNRDLDLLTQRGLRVGHSGRSGTGGPDERFAYLSDGAPQGAVVELSEMGGTKAEIYAMVADAAAAWDGADPLRTLEAPRA